MAPSSAREVFHLDRRAGMMGEDEGGNVVGRVVSTLALPARVRPFFANGSEHILSENSGTDVPVAARCKAMWDFARGGEAPGGGLLSTQSNHTLHGRAKP